MEKENDDLKFKLEESEKFKKENVDKLLETKNERDNLQRENSMLKQTQHELENKLEEKKDKIRQQKCKLEDFEDIQRRQQKKIEDLDEIQKAIYNKGISERNAGFAGGVADTFLVPNNLNNNYSLSLSNKARISILAEKCGHVKLKVTICM